MHRDIQSRYGNHPHAASATYASAGAATAKGDTRAAGDTCIENYVIFGMGATTFDQEGNRRWKNLALAQADKFFKSNSKERLQLAEFVVQQIRAVGGRFLKKANRVEKFTELDDAGATLKTCQLFKDVFPAPPPENSNPNPSSGSALDFLADIATAKKDTHQPGPNSSPSFASLPPTARPLLKGTEKGMETMEEEERKAEGLGPKLDHPSQSATLGLLPTEPLWRKYDDEKRVSLALSC